LEFFVVLSIIFQIIFFFLNVQLINQLIITLKKHKRCSRCWCQNWFI